MQQGRVVPGPLQTLRPTGLRVRRIVVVVGGVIVLLVAGSLAYLALTKRTPGGASAQDLTGWMPSRSEEAESLEPPSTKKPVITPVDRDAEILARLAALDAELQAMKNRPIQTAPAQPSQKAQGAPKKHGPMLFVEHKPDKKPTREDPTYYLAPGKTKIPCKVETVINSDAGETFTAVVSTTVWDSRTGQFPLILQGSTLTGRYAGATLLYGNERLPTISLFLTLDGMEEPIDLGDSPITDQAGTSGLVSEVDNHWWRLFGAVFIGGALRGGAQAIQAGVAGGGPAAQVSAGIAQSGNSAVTQQQSRALDTRPTIHVFGGQLCNVILMKPLYLPVATHTAVVRQ